MTRITEDVFVSLDEVLKSADESRAKRTAKGEPIDLWEMSAPKEKYDEYQKMRSAIFAKIKPKGHWKNPIDCWINEDDFDACSDACVFFTGSLLEVYAKRGNKVRVKAAGYYAAIGA
jgi:hypothetical protein